MPTTEHSKNKNIFEELFLTEAERLDTIVEMCNAKETSTSGNRLFFLSNPKSPILWISTWENESTIQTFLPLRAPLDKLLPVCLFSLLPFQT